VNSVQSILFFVKYSHKFIVIILVRTPDDIEEKLTQAHCTFLIQVIFLYS